MKRLRQTETQFQDAVIELAQRCRWKVAHFRAARTAKGWRTPVAADGKGFPDLVLVRDRIIFAELKRDGENPTPEQEAWLLALANALGREDDVLAVVWRPADWPDIERALARR